MSTIQEIEQAIAQLSPEEFARLRQWITEQSSLVKHSDTIQPRKRQLSPDEWIADLKAWSDSHPPVHHFVDDSRESIYEGRGE